jgi:heparosan-N-sulfate-glucuronate 5-epimerase
MGISNDRNKLVYLAITIFVVGIIAVSSLPSFIIEAHAAIIKKLDYYSVPWVYYATIMDGKPAGFQRNPVTTVAQANEFYDLYKSKNNESAKTFFLNNVNWLVNNAVDKGNYALLQYNFPIPHYNMQSAWYSAMANGQALQVLIKAHEITNDLRYLIAAKSLLNAFFIEVKYGGITYKDSPTDWWYEEYASSSKSATNPRVLNGMLFTVIAIYDYYNYTNDPDAKLLFEKGVNSIKNDLSKFNNNGYSYYDLVGNPAGKYHQTHVILTKKLYDLTGLAIFKEYSEFWKNYNPSLS